MLQSVIWMLAYCYTWNNVPSKLLQQQMVKDRLHWIQGSFSNFSQVKKSTTEHESAGENGLQVNEIIFGGEGRDFFPFEVSNLLSATFVPNKLSPRNWATLTMSTPPGSGLPTAWLTASGDSRGAHNAKRRNPLQREDKNQRPGKIQLSPDPHPHPLPALGGGKAREFSEFQLAE